MAPPSSRSDLAPVTVYLDSQDFSRFSPSHKDYSHLEPLRQELLALRAKGLVRYVFSDVHLFESLPVGRQQASFALERIRTIAEFCGNDSLTSSVTLFEGELRAVCGATPLPEWSDWYPNFELEEPDRSQINKDALLQFASNRKQRRAGARALKKRPSAGDGMQFAEELVVKYPFLGNDKRTLRLYSMGKRPWSDVIALLRRSMRDIVGFSEWMVANWEQGQKFNKGLREGNRSTQHSLSTLYSNMRATFESSQLPQDTTSQILRTVFDEQRARSFSEFVEKNRRRLALDAPMQAAGATVNQTLAPSLFTALSFLAEIAYRSAVPKYPRNPDKQTGSDFADALHLLFLPHVDVFRADQFTCSVLSSIPYPGGATVCPSLDRLPQVIQRSIAGGT